MKIMVRKWGVCQRVKVGVMKNLRNFGKDQFKLKKQKKGGYEYIWEGPEPERGAIGEVQCNSWWRPVRGRADKCLLATLRILRFFLRALRND